MTTPNTLEQILYNYANDQLKALAKLTGYQGRVRKQELVEHVHHALTNPDMIAQFWHALDTLARQAVTQAYHNEGMFNQQAFVAQYGELPDAFKKRGMILSYFYRDASLLNLFIHHDTIPAEIRALLVDIVPPPERFQLTGQETLPDVITLATGKQVTPVIAETEFVGPQDLQAYLRLVATNEMKLTTSQRTTATSMRKLYANLQDGDFIDHAALDGKLQANDSIRPFGLDVFVQNSGLVNGFYKSLTLSKAGETYLRTQDPAILLEAVETWAEKTTSDELNRLSALKGLGSKQTALAPTAPRREAILEALSWCPTNVWIHIHDFYRAMKIWHFDFAVENTPDSNLYVNYREYGQIHSDEMYWELIKGSYVRVILWEYLATLGLIDLCYTDLEVILYSDQYYIDEPYSRYDGLCYFRINNLGAYIFGQASEYQPSQNRSQGMVSIDADLNLSTDADQLTPNDKFHLELMTDSLNTPGHYRLSLPTLLSTLETGTNLDSLETFLTTRHNGPLPQAVHDWLAQARDSRNAYKVSGRGIFIKARTIELADQFANDPTLQRLCHRIDSKTFVVAASKERQVRERLKELSYLLDSK